MGDPKFSRRKYDTPSHPWRAERIKNETELQKRFGLKNKREIWKAQSIVRTLRSQSRDLQARTRIGEHQAEIETKQLLDKCGKLGLLPMEGTTLNDILSLSLEDVLTRRFQTMVFQKGLAYSADQARQFIVHRHITINGRIVNVPGYMVRRAEENAISYATRSPIANELHPMRPKPKEAVEVEKEKAREEQVAKDLEPARPVAPKKKEAPAEHIPKAVKPSLEKMIEKDGSKEEQEPLPEDKETGEIQQAPEPATKPKAEKHKAEKHKADDKQKADEKPKAEKHKTEKKPKAEKHKTEEK
jgi:small subunit ribosomal protein S4